MQALARRAFLRSLQAGPAVPATTRSMSGAVDIKAAEASLEWWKKITIFAGFPFIVVLGVITYNGHHEEHHVEQKAYPYLKIRAREFPWGKCDLLDFNCKEE